MTFEKWLEAGGREECWISTHGGTGPAASAYDAGRAQGIEEAAVEFSKAVPNYSREELANSVRRLLENPK